MEIIQQGSGPTLVLVPGIQGRWEYLRPAITALARRFRVITFPLCDERSSTAPFDEAKGLDNYVAQTAAVMDELQIARAIVCGVSFGGLVALRFAGAHPDRTAAVVLASTPGPAFQLRPRHAMYARLPWIFGPLFLVESPVRLRREVAAAYPAWLDRLRFAASQLRTLLGAPLSTARMARRALMISRIDVADACRRLSVPTLVVTGDPGLDYVIPAGGGSEYARIVPNARHVVIERTGHLGTITRPEEFAQVVARFVLETTTAGHAA